MPGVLGFYCIEWYIGINLEVEHGFGSNLRGYETFSNGQVTV